MKIKSFGIMLLLTSVLSSCNNVDDMLKPSDAISVSALETKDTLRVTPTDTVKFKFMVSTNGGAIKHINLEVDENIVEKLPQYATFYGMGNTGKEKMMDENGNMLQNISTAIVEYTVLVKKNPAVIGHAFKAVLRATNQSGKTASNYIHFIGNNTRIKTTNLEFINTYTPGSGQKFFFDPFNYKAYTDKNFISTTAEPIPGADQIRENIAMVIGYKYVAANPALYYRIFSPDSEEAEAYMKTEANIKNYNRAEMKSCVFFRLEGVGGYELDDAIQKETNAQKKAQLITDRNNLDWKYFDSNINDAYVAALDFSNASKSLVVKGGFYAFKTYDGRKGVFWINYFSNFNHPIPITIRRYIFQAISAEV